MWRLVDAYRDRVRIKIARVTYENQDTERTLSIEVDNNGRHPVLLERQATLRGLSLGFNRREDGWERARLQVNMRLSDEERSLQPVSSRLFRWKLDEDYLHEAGLDYVCWLRVRIRISNRRRSVAVRLPRIWAEAIGPIRYWWGYASFRYGKYLQPAARRRKVNSE
jgi:hypothetical protein